MLDLVVALLHDEIGRCRGKMLLDGNQVAVAGGVGAASFLFAPPCLVYKEAGEIPQKGWGHQYIGCSHWERRLVPNEVSASRVRYQHCRKWSFLGGGCKPRTSIYGNVDITL